MSISRTNRPVMPRWAAPAILIGSAVVVVGTATPPGSAMVASLQGFLAYYAGVFALVGFSITVMIGLLATERTMLGIRHRVLAQAVHHSFALASVAFLVAHIFVKVLAGHASAADAVVFRATSVGMGALSSDLFIIVLVTGLLRAWFAGQSKPGRWRILHALAYASWPISILHGLTAGRPPAGWVTAGYLFSLGGVGLALLTRLFVVVGRGEPTRSEPPVIEMTTSAPIVVEDERERANRAFWGPTK
jgi:hypothetical protein